MPLNDTAMTLINLSLLTTLCGVIGFAILWLILVTMGDKDDN